MSFALSLEPTAAQKEAIDEIVADFEKDNRAVTLQGATGTGKTMIAAATIARLNKPALLIAHNKTLAAQLTSELRALLPEAAVEYFVSYYDYYQPEAYLPGRDLYIEKEAQINAEIDRLRHAATTALLTRPDTVIVASVSCIYGLGDPDLYKARSLGIRVSDTFDRDALLDRLVALGYTRHDVDPERGQFRVRGDNIDLISSSEEDALRISLFGDEVEALARIEPASGALIESLDQALITAATHYALPEEESDEIIEGIRKEMEAQVKKLEKRGMALEAERLYKRTNYDLELLAETGFCPGIENYSRHLDRRIAGETPWCLLDYFPDDYLCILDESHQTIPQIGAMSVGDKARKETLIEHGFRLPSALDNRPQTFAEFLSKAPELLCLSATPGPWEEDYPMVDLVVRPTAIVDPEIDIRPRDGQADDLLGEIKERADKNERVLVTCLTKKMAEKLAEFLADNGIRSRYLHSDIDTLERVAILRDLRAGKFDCLVGVNLLREGLDLPEVSLVAILDADQEGFLRGRTSLIQTIGRAARHPEGRVIMYADKESQAMKEAIEETERRQKIQLAYNQEHNLTPKAIVKAIASGLEAPQALPESNDLAELEAAMLEAAEKLDFEEAARLRDQIATIKRD